MRQLIVHQVEAREPSRVVLVGTDPRDGAVSGFLVASGDTLSVIVDLLRRLDSVEIHRLQTEYLPKARIAALSDESRTRPVKLAVPPQTVDECTVAVPVDSIRRDYEAAQVEAGNHENYGASGAD